MNDLGQNLYIKISIIFIFLLLIDISVNILLIIESDAKKLSVKLDRRITGQR